MKADTIDKSPTLVNGNLPDPEKVNGVEQELEMKAHELGINAAFAIKVALINQELARIGMGRYQVMLFFTAGMGWFVDNLFLQGIAILLPSIQQEFDPAYVAQSTLALFCGLCIGAAFWGCSADIVGRRVAFNITLFISGAFGLVAGASTSFTMWCGFVSCIGFGLGGNLPVDGALYLEVLPTSYQWTLTLLSAFWAIGQVVGSVIAWPLVINFSCPLAAEPSSSTGNEYCQPGTTSRSGGQHQAWRYSMYIFGAMTLVMWIIRFFAFPIQESPKWLASKNRDTACIAALQKIAKTNRTTCTLTVEDLQNASLKVGVDPTDAGMSVLQTLRASLSKLSLSNITPLFSTTRLAINTTLIASIWALIGLAYPLFNAFLGLYLTGLPGQTRDSAYSNYAIQAACGVPGSIIAAALVEWRVSGKWSFVAGRKGAMALATLLSGIFLFLFTQATTNQAVLGWNCASALTQNAMYGILFAYTPEVFPTSSRGSGNAICSSLNRMFGIIAPLLQSYASPSAATPVFISAALFIVSGVLMLALPIDTAGVDAL